LEAEGGVCEGLSNVRVTAADKSLRASCRAGTPKSSTDIYRWDTPYSLRLVKSIGNSAETMAEQRENAADLKAEKAEGRKDARDARKAAKEEDDEDEE
jgi:hypothetical protein